MKVEITKLTMDFEGGIVPCGARYYCIKWGYQPSYVARAADIDVEGLVRLHGIDNVSWPFKTRDLSNGRHAVSQIGRRAIAATGFTVAV